MSWPADTPAAFGEGNCANIGIAHRTKVIDRRLFILRAMISPQRESKPASGNAWRNRGNCQKRVKAVDPETSFSLAPGHPISPHFSHWMSGLGKTSVEGESRAVFWSDEKDDGRFGLCAAVRGCLRDVVRRLWGS